MNKAERLEVGELSARVRVLERAQREKLDRLPEGLASTRSAEDLEEAADRLEEVADLLEDLSMP